MTRRIAQATGAVLLIGAALLTRRMTLTWGTREDEFREPLPGDELGTAPVVATRAISIGAPPSEVWPWLVQMGADKGGFYSYDVLEQLIGLPITNADRVEERWQQLAQGDTVRLAPQAALRVDRLAPESHLVLTGDSAGPQPPFDFTWAFVLRPMPDGGTRLLVRERYRPTSWWGRIVVELTQPASSIMSARMLRGIRDRAQLHDRQ